MKKILLTTGILCVLSILAFSQEDAFQTQVAEAATSAPARYLEASMNNLSGPRNINSFTLECWVYIPDTTSTDAHHLFGTSTASFNRGFSFELNRNKLFIRLFANNNTFDALGTTTVRPGTWNHLAATFDNSTDVIKLYLNGVEDGTATQVWNYSDINQKFFVGVQPRFKTITRENSIDEIKIWNFTKSASEIMAGMTGCQDPDTRLVLYYDFEGTTGTTVSDKAGNVNSLIVGHTVTQTGITEGQKYCIGDTVYVNLAASGDNDGTSWVNAYTDLQNAFNNVGRSDQVWIAKGTYIRDETNRSVSFLWQKDNIEVYGGFDGTESMLSQRNWVMNETILSGDLGAVGTATDNAYTVLTGPYSQTIANTIARAYIDGLIIQDGYANAATTNKFGRFGGGFFTESYVSDIEFVNCTFRNNTAVAGGGISVSSEFIEKKITLINCKLMGNKARAGAPFDLATYGRNMTVTITGTLIADNEVIDLEGDNGGYGHGGRAMAYNGGDIGLGIANTTWVNNKDNSTSTDKILLAVHRRFSGGIGFLALQNCIFSNNDHSTNNLSFPAVSGNGGFISKSVNHCLLDDTTNISAVKIEMILGDAQFVNLNAGDYRLMSTSPAIDKGSESGLDLTSVDLAGTPRILGQKIDLGCYEYNASASIRSENIFSATLYPNPTLGVLRVKSKEHINKVTVLSLRGEILLESVSSAIDVSNLLPGLYILQAESPESLWTTRFIKK